MIMKHTVSIEIARPLDEVVQLLADPAQLPLWLPGLVRHEPLNGRHGEVGTRSRVAWRAFRPVRSCTTNARSSHRGRSRGHALAERERVPFHRAADAPDRAVDAPGVVAAAHA
ncbi:protein of unknown function [Micropruina glycogenica]|uniref:Uncharacterized protein n=1 Tax=Micropruina glycogenica TaxID=75385 RepID=A0A2N9JHP4_9ACTN|nr:protein of unknown function [Micropruina glycogenica]